MAVRKTVSRSSIDSAVSLECVDYQRESLVIILKADFCLVLDGKNFELSPKRRPTEAGVLFSFLLKPSSQRWHSKKARDRVYLDG